MKNTENKFTEGCEKLPNGSYRLREKITVYSKDNIPTSENLKESIQDTNYSGLPIYGTYLVKIWSKNRLNKNGRSYVRVFEKVLKDQKVTIGFVDHPEDNEESYKNVILVSKNPQMIVDDNGEEWLAVETTLIGRPHGENCEAVLQQGGFLEFSSSCLGDVDPSTGEVLLDGFLLERYNDVVVNSSNAQLFFKTKEEPRDITSNKGDTQLYDNRDQEKVTILKDVDSKLEEKTGEISMSDKLSERALELNIKGMVKDADSKTNLLEKKETLLSALPYAEDLTDKALAETITKKINEVEEGIHALAEKGKDVDGLNTSITSLKETKETLEKEIASIKEEKTKVEENYNQLISLFETKQYRASQTELLTNKKLVALVESLKRENKRLDKRMKKAKEQALYFEALSNTKVEADFLIESSSQLKSVLVENEMLSTKVASIYETEKENRKKAIQEKRASFRETTSRVKEKEDEVEFRNNEVKVYFDILLEEEKVSQRDIGKYAKCRTLQEAQTLRMKEPIHEKASVSEVTGIDKILEEKGYI